MNFIEWCRTLEGRWVNVYTVDSAFDGDGNYCCVAGKLKVHDDFLEVTYSSGSARGVPINAVTTISPISNPEELETQYRETLEVKKMLESI